MSDSGIAAGDEQDHRDAILRRIAAGLGRAVPDEGSLPTARERPAEVTARLEASTRRTLPRAEADLVAQLTRNMESVQMSVVRLQESADVPGAVAFWLESEGLAGDVTIAPALGALAWPSGDDGQGRHWREGAASGTEATSVTPCLVAVAETGSVATVSGGDTPATLNFLPENHVVVVRTADVVAHVEDAFDALRGLERLPRALNFVTGPSRTADIEQTLEIGAHGPRRMHVLIVEGD